MKRAVTIVSILVIIISLAGIIYFNVKQTSFENEISSLEEMIIAPSIDEQNSAEIPEKDASIDFSQLIALNPDIVAWVTIEGTGIRYPVMQNSGGNEYYMYHNFEKKEDPNGLPFLDIRNSPLLVDESMIIYGHNMKNGLLFHDLESYQDKEYFNKHSMIQLDTPAGRRNFRIFAVLNEKISSEYSFKYYLFTNFEDQQEKDEFITDAVQSSIYDTSMTADTNAAILTLSTCDNTTVDGRIAVVAFEITGEW